MKHILKNAPKAGFVIACFEQQLVFTSYEIKDDKLMVNDGENLDFSTAEECHFFDKNREYRRIIRSSRQDVIETILTSEEEDLMDSDLIFIEEVLVKPCYADREHMPSHLTMINRYRYSEYDTIVLEDYRISV